MKLISPLYIFVIQVFHIQRPFYLPSVLFTSYSHTLWTPIYPSTSLGTYLFNSQPVITITFSLMLAINLTINNHSLTRLTLITFSIHFFAMCITGIITNQKNVLLIIFHSRCLCWCSLPLEFLLAANIDHFSALCLHKVTWSALNVPIFLLPSLKISCS